MIHPIKYSVEIQGIKDPFRWQIIKRIGGSITRTGKVGEASTVAECTRDAAQAAFELEEERRHIETRQEVELFEINENGDVVIEEVPNTLPEGW